MMFHHLLEVRGEREACRTTVELLAMAHERACEAELAQILTEDLAERRLPCISSLRTRFCPDPADMPQVVVQLVPLSIYDGLIEQGAAA